ncbi:MAG: hypothetical protein RR595_04880 [Lysinibacillus sp.]
MEGMDVTCELKTDEEGEILKGKKRRLLLGEKRNERAKRLDKRRSDGAIIINNRIFGQN